MDSKIDCRGHFYFDPQDPIYQDHFPGHAVVPGTLIIHAFMEAVKSQAGEPRTCSIRDFRFKRFVAPGRYAFWIQSRNDGRLACTMYDDTVSVATGTL